jgi:hypothetical protein
MLAFECPDTWPVHHQDRNTFPKPPGMQHQSVMRCGFVDSPIIALIATLRTDTHRRRHTRRRRRAWPGLAFFAVPAHVCAPAQVSALGSDRLVGARPAWMVRACVRALFVPFRVGARSCGAYSGGRCGVAHVRPARVCRSSDSSVLARPNIPARPVASPFSRLRSRVRLITQSQPRTRPTSHWTLPPGSVARRSSGRYRRMRTATRRRGRYDWCLVRGSRLVSIWSKR